jgi:hypothetical protein
LLSVTVAPSSLSAVACFCDAGIVKNLAPKGLWGQRTISEL